MRACRSIAPKAVAEPAEARGNACGRLSPRWRRAQIREVVVVVVVPEATGSGALQPK